MAVIFLLGMTRVGKDILMLLGLSIAIFGVYAYASVDIKRFSHVVLSVMILMYPALMIKAQLLGSVRSKEEVVWSSI